jgi:hypothetical protein
LFIGVGECVQFGGPNNEGTCEGDAAGFPGSGERISTQAGVSTEEVLLGQHEGDPQSCEVSPLRESQQVEVGWELNVESRCHGSLDVLWLTTPSTSRLLLRRGGGEDVEEELLVELGESTLEGMSQQFVAEIHHDAIVASSMLGEFVWWK